MCVVVQGRVLSRKLYSAGIDKLGMDNYMLECQTCNCVGHLTYII